ncbi:Pentatricopeptide repeat-containing protein [Thalictrum thalictroides]|uniref:Pentatricopeptide repeat-containing protein n=1 Tax=Thalictrum thalictroides TaxID=46969 RepID=A0A7J6VUP8_THATH|nr:Pentatricopeptide repeat-containing protein [Thalictrum thalictroides]
MEYGKKVTKPSCSSLKHLYQIHAHIITSGFHKDGFLISEILRVCALLPFGNLNYARLVLFRELNPKASSWNHVIRAYSKSKSPREALVVYVEMRKSRITPSELTFPFLFKACASLLAVKEGKQIQVHALKFGVSSNVYVQNGLINFYGSCREVNDARRVFDGMLIRTVVSWNSIVTACVENSMFDDSLLLFSDMRGFGFEPDSTTMVILLSACAELGNLSLGRWIHCQVIEKGLLINCQLGTALVDMYAKCGALYYARLVFDRMIERNVWTWSAMILGFAQHGLAQEALKVFEGMKINNVRPNYVTFLGVLCACSHARMVDEGYRVFHDMTHSYGIKPMMTHYGAMVDVLGRSGKLEEAYDFITRMPIDPDPPVWRTLLSACSIHDVTDSTSVGMKVRKRLLELEPERCGNLVMVANMYAEVGSWEEAANVRKVMKDLKLKKMAGESCVEVGGLIHKFFSGDDTRDCCEGIYQSLADRGY